ncbi:MAG: ABC transporter permease, partial [Pseudomonas sp.]
MTAHALQPAGGPLHRLTDLLYKKPNLYLAMLLVPPLLWFGVIYFAPLLTFLWQGVYTYDEMAMAATPDLTWANLLALFEPANYDIILRTLGMAIVVSLASAALA